MKISEVIKELADEIAEKGDRDIGEFFIIKYIDGDLIID